MIRFLKIFFGTVFTLLILIGSCVFYAFKIEPYRIASNQLYLNEKTSDFIKVVQFSDTHIKADFNYKNLDKVVNYINKQNPDVVVFTGDLYDNYAKYHDDEHIIKELQKINATYDKIAIWGNRDCGVSAKYCYAAHESRLHQNDRCKRFTLCLVLTVRFRSLAPWGKLFQLFI